MKQVKFLRYAVTVIHASGKPDPQSLPSRSSFLLQLLGYEEFFMGPETQLALQSTEQKINLLNHPLGQRIEYLRSHWQQEGLPQNWHELPRTGFWIEPQMKQLPENWTRSDVSAWLSQKVKPDVQGYTLEYLAKKGVFPIQYDIHKQSDGAYLTAPMYGGAKLLDVIDSRERNGALVDAIDDVTTFFADSSTPDGSLAIITSVCGPSDIFDPHTGKEIIFPDSQRYLLQKRGDSIVGFTIRTDATLKEERAFIKALTGISIAETAAPEEYVRAVAKISAHTPNAPQTFSDVIDMMQQIHARPLAFEDKKHSITIPWQEIYEDLEREDLWDFPDKTGDLFEEFKDFVLQVDSYAKDEAGRPYLKQLIQEGLAATILELSRYIEGSKQTRRGVSSQDTTVSLPAPLLPPSYGSAMKTLQAAGGCSKSGEENSPLSSGIENPVEKFIKSLSPRLGETSGKKEWFTCPKCDYHANGPVGDQCPSCGLNKDDYEGPKCA